MFFGVLGYVLIPVMVNSLSSAVTLLLGNFRYGLKPWIKENTYILIWAVIPFILGFMAEELLKLVGTIPLISSLALKLAARLIGA